MTLLSVSIKRLPELIDVSTNTPIWPTSQMTAQNASVHTSSLEAKAAFTAILAMYDEMVVASPSPYIALQLQFLLSCPK